MTQQELGDGLASGGGHLEVLRGKWRGIVRGQGWLGECLPSDAASSYRPCSELAASA